MITRNLIIIALSMGLFCSCVQSETRNLSSEISSTEFKNPSNEYRPWVYWYWLNGNVTKEGCLEDIRAMAEVGIAGVFLMDIGIHTPGPAKYRSPEWWDILKAVAKECNKYNIKISFHDPGWAVAGAPWITPELSMQEVSWSEVRLNAGQSINVSLPQPRTRLDTYEDIAVLAYPSPLGATKNLFSDAELFDIDGKKINNREGLDDYANLDKVVLSEVFDLVLKSPASARSIFINQAEFYEFINLKLSAWVNNQWKVVGDFESFNPGGFYGQNASGSFELVKSDKFRFEFGKGNPSTKKSFFYMSLNAEYRVQNWPNKAMFSGEKDFQFVEDKSITPTDCIKLNEVINLTDKMTPEGYLKWDAPTLDSDKEWVVLRVGYTPTGREGLPSPAGIGPIYETDKLSKAAAQVNYKGLWEPVFKNVGKELSGRVFFGNHADSWEAGWQNWTALMPAEFKQRNGYDIISYLPAITGRLLENQSITEGFLWDFKRTISKMTTENFYMESRRLANKDGLYQTGEPYGDCGGPFIGLDAASALDFPMMEAWWPSTSLEGKWYGEPVFAGRTSGAKRIGYEAFTSGDAFVAHPYLVKGLGDKIFASGINWYVIHVYAAQPRSGPHLMPGFTVGGNGIHFNRGNTWFYKSKPWVDYVSRCQYMLRQGQPIADVLYYTGDINAGTASPYSPSTPEGYEYDAVSFNQLSGLKVKDKKIILPNGKSYYLMVYNSTGFETNESLKELYRLIKDGATIISNSWPANNPSLGEVKTNPDTFKKLVNQIWGDKEGERKIGKGKLLIGYEVGAVLKEMNVPRAYHVVEGDLNLQMTHRRINNDDMFFLANVDKRSSWVTCEFRTTGSSPKLYDPQTGDIKDYPYFQDNGRVTRVPLYFEDTESKFIVFEKNTRKTPLHVEEVTNSNGGKMLSDFELFNQDGNFCINTTGEGNYQVKLSNGELRKVTIGSSKRKTLTGPWEVNFPPGWGAPEEIVFPELIEWNKHSNEGIKYFSGTATYKKEFSISNDFIKNSDKVYLDLGDVQVIADVKLNGESLGILWKPPFQVEIKDVLVAGKNTIKIEVVNNWPNRLIGDMQYPEDRYTQPGFDLADWYLNDTPRPEKRRMTFCTAAYYRKTDSLLPSGLIGPVVLSTSRNALVEK